MADELRIIAWNIDNLVSRVVPAPAIASHGLRASLARLGEPDVLCLQEIRLRPKDEALIDMMERALPGYRCHASLARDPRNVTHHGGRSYGVATYVNTRVGESIATTPPWDREGRVLVTELPAHGLAIVNVYGVQGSSTPYYDHQLGRTYGDRHAFKCRVQARLAELAGALAARGLAIVMIGDWNVARTRDDVHPRLRTEEPHVVARDELDHKFLRELGLVDAYRELHPDERAYTWFDPGARTLEAARLDFALVSAWLMPRVREASILDDPEDRPGSDHAPITLTLAL